MHVLNVNPIISTEVGGGQAERTFQMSKYLSQLEDVEVSILVLDLGIEEKHYKHLNEVNIITIPCLNRRFYLPQLFSGKISSAVKNADIIHLMGHWTAINLIVYFWIILYKKPYVVCPAGALPIFGRSKSLKTIYNLMGGRSYIKNANRCIAISTDEYEHFNQYGVSSSNIILIPNGINPELYAYEDESLIRKKFSLGEEPFILFVGRLNYIKGPDLLLDAFLKIINSYPNYKLVFAGPDDGMQQILQEKTQLFGLDDRVLFVGFVNGNNKSALYHAATMLVIPSRLEAMSIVVLESAISGTPVLMTDCCGLDEMAGGNGGVIVEPNVSSIVEGLDLMLKNSEELPVRGEKLRKYVKSKFEWKLVVCEYVDVYKSILKDYRS